MELSLDLDEVWIRQAVPESLMADLIVACEAAADVLMNPASGLKNVTEWAKKQACWEAVKASEAAYPDGPATLRIRILARSRAH